MVVAMGGICAAPKISEPPKNKPPGWATISNSPRFLYKCRKLRSDFRVVVGRVTSECHAPLFCIGDSCAQRHRGNAAELY